MRRFALVSLLAVLLTPALSGCGGSAEEGMPKDVDMSKDYTPTVPLPGMSPGGAKKAQK